VGLRMAERCSKDFPKRMGTELQASVSVSLFRVIGYLNSNRCRPPFPSSPNPLLDRILAVRPLLEGSFWKIHPKASHKQPQPVRDRGPQLPHAVRRASCAPDADSFLYTVHNALRL
jgi:hypothetical protein